MLYFASNGGVGERSKSPLSKSGISERVSEVRILPPPQVYNNGPRKENKSKSDVPF